MPEEQETIEGQATKTIHKTIGGYGTSYYLTACGLYAGNYFVHVSDNEVTCPRCKSLKEPNG
jgi:hypothetical protein